MTLEEFCAEFNRLTIYTANQDMDVGITEDGEYFIGDSDRYFSHKMPSVVLQKATEWDYADTNLDDDDDWLMEGEE